MAGVARPRGDWPVTHVAAVDAEAFCRWTGGRLPLASEWEYAARGPERRIFPWGDRWNPGLAPLDEQRPAAVGSLRQDTYFTGLTGMTGNVWEWVRLHDGGLGLKGGSYREFNPANMRAAVSREEQEGVTLSDDGIRCAFDVLEWPASRPVDSARVEEARSATRDL